MTGWQIFYMILGIISVGVITAVLLYRKYKRKELSLWQKGDELVFFSEFGGTDPKFYLYNQLAKQHPLQVSDWPNKATGSVIKWNMKEARVLFGDGKERYVKHKYIKKNLDYIERERNDDMDDFMEDILNKKQQERQDKIDNILNS